MYLKQTGLAGVDWINLAEDTESCGAFVIIVIGHEVLMGTYGYLWVLIAFNKEPAPRRWLVSYFI
jgi:hypothetical protein